MMALRCSAFQARRALARCVVAPQRSFSSGKPLQSVCVVGAGQMGSGIAYVAAVNAGLPVKIIDVSAERLDSALNTHKNSIANMLSKQVAKGKMSEEQKAAAMARFTTATSLDVLKQEGQCPDIVIEAVNENLELKRSIFQQLDELTAPETVLATNTSSIAITKIAAATQRPDKVIGMHFMQPVPIMSLVEIISGLRTSEDTLLRTVALAEAMGKTTTRSKDMPGFIINRILMPYINEAVYALQDGVASIEDIDKTMKLGANVPMGPLTLADFIGLDTCLSIMQVLHTQLGDSKYRPCPLLAQYVDAGLLGLKTKQGFYKY